MSGFAQVATYGRVDTGGLLSASPVIAVAATAQPERARAFYGYVLGLALMEETPLALVFDAGGTKLRVEKVRQVTPSPHGCFGWAVADILGIVRGLAARGIAIERLPGQMHDGDGVWFAPTGEKVAWFRDPDGNLLSATEFPQR
jgi:catechol 2,3-dioxygenase-like lactoylglutathione lyase family enzyme